MTPPVTLREYESTTVELTDVELRDLIAADTTGALSINALGGGSYRLGAGSRVGAVVTPSHAVLIRPKVGLENLFLMLGVSVPDFSARRFAFDRDLGLLPAMAGVFADAADRATVRGVLRGYLAREERLIAPRGRIDLVAQLRRPGAPIPIACRYDDFTADILLNRGIVAAIHRLSRVPNFGPQLRERLHRVLARFDEVSSVPVSPEELECWKPTRLDAHYETAIRLAALVLRNLSLRDREGAQMSASFTIDMNDVFQAFVADRLARHLGPSIRVREEPSVRLAVGSTRTMYPDLVFAHAEREVYVGDSKYKLSSGQARMNDYYQLLAYTTVMELDEGVLVYCQDTNEPPDRPLEVRHSGKTLWTYRLPMSGSVDQVERELQELARWIARRVAVVQGHARWAS